MQKSSKHSQASFKEFIFKIDGSFLLQREVLLVQILYQSAMLYLSIDVRLPYKLMILLYYVSLTRFADVYIKLSPESSVLLYLEHEVLRVQMMAMIFNKINFFMVFLRKIWIVYNFIINLVRMFLQSYQIFVSQIREISFPKIEQKFKEFSQTQLNKWLSPYVPKLHEFSLEFDQHKREQQKMKNVPLFDGKKSYDNNENLHRRIIALFKDYLASKQKDFKQFLRLTTDIDLLSNILSKVQVLRFKNKQFNLIYYLFTCGSKSIRLYLKLREQIVKTNTFQKTKFLPISTHNKAKYVDKYSYLDTINIPNVQWKEIINLAGYQYDQDLMKLIFTDRTAINAVQIIEYCLWLNKEYASINTSPSKYG